MTTDIRYLLLGSRHDRLDEPTSYHHDPMWAAWYKATRLCLGTPDPRFRCYRERPDLQVRPEPIEPLVTGEARGFSRSLFDPTLNLLRDDAKELFAPFLPSVVWGRVWRKTSSGREPTPYSTMAIPRTDAVDLSRGKSFIAPQFCGVCVRASCWAPSCRHMGILRGQIRDRPVLFDGCTFLAVHPEFFHDMNLRERFADLKVVHKIKIYERDPMGWVLPGDPEWDGVWRAPPGWKDLPNACITYTPWPSPN